MFHWKGALYSPGASFREFLSLLPVSLVKLLVVQITIQCAQHAGVCALVVRASPNFSVDVFLDSGGTRIESDNDRSSKPQQEQGQLPRLQKRAGNLERATP